MLHVFSHMQNQGGENHESRRETNTEGEAMGKADQERKLECETVLRSM